MVASPWGRRESQSILFHQERGPSGTAPVICSAAVSSGCATLRGGDTGPDLLLRVNTEKRDDVGNREVRLAIIVRGGAAGITHRLWREGDDSAGAVIDEIAGAGGRRYDCRDGIRRVSGGVIPVECVRMVGHLRGEDGDVLGPDLLAYDVRGKPGSRALMNNVTAAK